MSKKQDKKSAPEDELVAIRTRLERMQIRMSLVATAKAIAKDAHLDLKLVYQSVGIDPNDPMGVGA